MHRAETRHMSSVDLGPVSPRTLSDAAAERLRVAISRGSLAPGTRLVESDLAVRLGMSRIPVREAIQRLAEEGLVKRVPHHGTIVAIPSRDDIEEISTLRIVLERFVMERVIPRWQPADEARLRQIVTAMCVAASQQDARQVGEQDYQFHATLWTIADHRLLLEVVSNLRSRISRFLYEASSALPISQVYQHAVSHGDLIDVVSSGHVARAQLAITEHILAAKERILAHYDRTISPKNGGPG
jgi:DNA-binding GntR family transcriptional regulator